MPASPIRHCFIDSNIWLYAFIESDDAVKSAGARQLIRATEPIISTQVINEVSVNLLKRTDFTEEAVCRLIDSFYAYYSVVEIGKETLLLASELRRRYSLSYWDSTIVASALGVEASALYTEDMQHGLIVEERLRVINPFVLE
jgi:predicted nucleic acid-binding protein